MLHFIDRREENRVIISREPPVCRHPIHPTFVSRNVARDKNVAELSDKKCHGIIRQIGAAEKKTIGMSHGSFGVTLCKNVKDFFGKQEVNDVKQN